MLVIHLPFENLPTVKLTDTVYYVLQLMDQYNVRELAVAESDEFAGLIKEETLLNADEDLKLEDLQHYFLKISVNTTDHFLKAVALANASNLQVLPVTEANGKLAGVVGARNLLKKLDDFMQLNEPGAIIVLEVETAQYSFSEICRLVESNDAQITQLNTSGITEDGKMLVTIKLNKLEVSDIIATFQRYEYHVKHYFGEELYANELKSNYENLMSYLNV